MKKICLCFQLHQPYRLRRYRFFDIGNEHHYEDEFQDSEIFERMTRECYLPANRLMLDLLKRHPEFHVSYSISGIAIEQMETTSSALLDSFRELAATGRVEFLAEPYAHSLASLYDVTEFVNQVKKQQAKLNELFGAKPSKVLCNTELIYSDEIAPLAQSMGFEGMLTEGAKHILGWKSPNYLYASAPYPKVKLLLRNPYLSELISRDFTSYGSPNYPVTADKVVGNIQSLPQEEELVVLYMNYEVLGVSHRAESGIFDFFKALPDLAQQAGIGFATPSQLVEEKSPIGKLSVLYPITPSDEEKSTKNWTGNLLQQGALKKLEEWGERVRTIQDNKIKSDWLYLQCADHFYYMNTSGAGRAFSPYSSAYDAFNNYMNVLSDFLLRVEKLAPKSFDTDELNSYNQTITNQNKRIKELEQELAKLKKEVKKKGA